MVDGRAVTKNVDTMVYLPVSGVVFVASRVINAGFPLIHMTSCRDDRACPREHQVV